MFSKKQIFKKIFSNFFSKNYFEISIINFEIAQRNSQRNSAQNVVAFRVNSFKGVTWGGDHITQKIKQKAKHMKKEQRRLLPSLICHTSLLWFATSGISLWIHQIRYVGLCLCRPVKIKKSFLFFYFGI